MEKGNPSKITGTVSSLLRYGENAYQAPACLVETETDDRLAIHKFLVHAGNPSMINITDIDRALATMTRLAAAIDINIDDIPSIAIGVKHGNACGASFGFTSKSEVIKKMLEGNLKSIFGGAVMVNFFINVHIAQLLLTHGTDGKQRPLDIVVGSDIDEEAISLLKRKNDRCLIMTNKELEFLKKEDLDKSVLRRQIRGGWIEQPSPTFILDLNSDDISKYGSSKFIMEEETKMEQYYNTILAWAVCATSNSNTITMANDGKLIGNGVGQQDRVGAAELCIKRAKEAGHEIEGAVAVSDSFFPYPDAPLLLIDEGVSRILATSGSIKDSDVIKLFGDKKCELLHIPDKIGRIFSNH